MVEAEVMPTEAEEEQSEQPILHSPLLPGAEVLDLIMFPVQEVVEAQEPVRAVTAPMLRMPPVQPEQTEEVTVETAVPVMVMV